MRSVVRCVGPAFVGHDARQPLSLKVRHTQSHPPIKVVLSAMLRAPSTWRSCCSARLVVKEGRGIRRGSPAQPVEGLRIDDVEVVVANLEHGAERGPSSNVASGRSEISSV